MPSFHATTRKSPLTEKKTACYLHELANEVQCHGRSLSVVPQWLRKGKYILRATIWCHCQVANLAKLLALSNFC